MVDPKALAEARRAVGRQLAALRKAAGFTQAGLASYTGYVRTSVANVERGRQNTPRTFWQRADETLGAGGVLVAAFDDLEGLVAKYKQETAQALEARRAAKVRQWRQESPDELSGMLVVASTALSAGERAAPDGAAVAFVHNTDSMFAGPGAWEPLRTVEDVDQFTLGDLMLRRDANNVLASLLVGGALTEPLERWVGDAAHLIEPKLPGALGVDEVHHIEAVAWALRHWENRFRLGIRRKAVIGQLNEVAELLKEGHSHTLPSACSRC